MTLWRSALMGCFALGIVGAAPAAGKGNPMVVLSTSLGDIKVELYADKAPITVKNFLDYAKAGYYDGTVFHRVIPGFMIQGGGMTADMQDKREGQKPPIKNESDNGLKNDTGTLAMARTGVPDSATSQFFINVKDNHALDFGIRGAGYAVFGEVMDPGYRSRTSTATPGAGASWSAAGVAGVETDRRAGSSCCSRMKAAATTAPRSTARSWSAVAGQGRAARRASSRACCASSSPGSGDPARRARRKARNGALARSSPRAASTV